MKKKCCRCKKEKLIEKFSKNKNSNDGYRWECKSCQGKYYKKFWTKNKEAEKIRKKKYRQQNKDKINLYNENYRKKNREKIKKRNEINKDKYKNNYLKNKYDISLEKYEQILKIQNNVCAICKEICLTGKCLGVDHCHRTGIVRGLLCSKCNRSLGGFNDSINLLLKAINYLKKWKWREEQQEKKSGKNDPTSGII